MKFAVALFLPFAALALATPAHAAAQATEGEKAKPKVTASASVTIVEAGTTKEGENRVHAQRTKKQSGETLVEFT